MSVVPTGPSNRAALAAVEAPKTVELPAGSPNLLNASLILALLQCHPGATALAHVLPAVC